MDTNATAPAQMDARKEHGHAEGPDHAYRHDHDHQDDSHDHSLEWFDLFRIGLVALRFGCLEPTITKRDSMRK